MEIKVLGTGCPKCKTLEKNVVEALAEMGKKANVEKVTDIAKIMEYGIMMTPGLVVDGVVKVSGRLPNKSELMEILRG